MFEFSLDTYIDKVCKSMPADMLNLFCEKRNNALGLDGIKMEPSATNLCSLRGEESSEIDKEKELKDLPIELDPKMDIQKIYEMTVKLLDSLQTICRQMAIPFFDEENTIESTLLNMGIQIKDKDENLTNGISFEVAYNIIMDFFKSTDMELPFLDTSFLTDIMSDMKPLAALYCCYFAMDYIYRHEENGERRLDFSSIREFYSCTENAEREIYNTLRRQKSTIGKVKEFKDPKFYNPRIAKNYEDTKKENADKSKRKYYESHIYNGNIIEYLQKSCYLKDNNLFMTDLVPSITYICLRTVGDLPNGGNTNKSSEAISVNILDNIDNEIRGGLIYAGDDGETFYKTFQSRIINYHTSDAMGKLINMAAVDDVFKMERLNQALKLYAEAAIKDKTAPAEKDFAVATVCSLLLYIPQPLIDKFSIIIKRIIEFIIADDIKQAFESLNIVFSFTAVVFPYTIGLLGVLMFLDAIKEKNTANIKNRIKEMERYLQGEEYDTLYSALTTDRKRTWSDDQYVFSVPVDKGNGRKNTVTDWKNKNKYSLNEIIGIMLNQKNGIAKSRTLVDENYTDFLGRCKNSEMYLKYRGVYKEISNRLFSPGEYVASLSWAFCEECIGRE